MDFVKEFENLLSKTINDGHYEQTKQLISQYPQTGMPYSLSIYKSINQYTQLSSSFSISFHGHSSIANGRLIFILSDNYILNYIAKQFGSFFQTKKCEIFFFDTNDFEISQADLFSFLKKGVHAAFFFNHVGLALSLQNGANLWETLSIPCYDFIVDHPMYYADSLDNPPANTTLLCADKTHVDYAKKYYPNLSNVAFLPTGGCQAIPYPDKDSFLKTYAQREIDLLFIGSFKHVPFEESSFDIRIRDYLKAHTSVPFDIAVEKILKEQNPALSLNDMELKIEIEKHRFLETNLLSEYRENLILAMLEAGLEIEVYGNGWENSQLHSHRNFHLHAPIAFEDGLQLMQKSKILLNHMAWFKNGSSERIFNAMANGALCVTDSSIFLDSILFHNQNCILYSLSPDSFKACASTLKESLFGTNPICQLGEVAYHGLQLSAAHTWQEHLAHHLL